MGAILIDLPDALQEDIDTIAAREYGDRTSVIRRLLARGVASELGPRHWTRSPDGPGDHAPDALSCSVCRDPIDACTCPARDLRRLLHRAAPVGFPGQVNDAPTDARPPPEAPALPPRRARVMPPAEPYHPTEAPCGAPHLSIEGVACARPMGHEGEHAIHVSKIGNVRWIDGIPSNTKIDAIVGDTDAALAHAARRLRERRIAQGLDPDTGLPPVSGNTDAAAVVRTAERGDVGTYADDVTP